MNRFGNQHFNLDQMIASSTASLRWTWESGGASNGPGNVVGPQMDLGTWCGLKWTWERGGPSNGPEKVVGPQMDLRASNGPEGLKWTWGLKLIWKHGGASNGPEKVVGPQMDLRRWWGLKWTWERGGASNGPGNEPCMVICTLFCCHGNASQRALLLVINCCRQRVNQPSTDRFSVFTKN